MHVVTSDSGAGRFTGLATTTAWLECQINVLPDDFVLQERDRDLELRVAGHGMVEQHTIIVSVNRKQGHAKNSVEALEAQFLIVVAISKRIRTAQVVGGALALLPQTEHGDTVAPASWHCCPLRRLYAPSHHSSL